MMPSTPASLQSKPVVPKSVTLPARMPDLRVVPMPSDVNHRGTIFGGWLLAQIDIACGIKAANRAHGLITTVAVNSLTFEAPVLIRDVVSIYVDITRVGTSSMTLSIEVYTERNPAQPEVHRVATGEWVFVAVDEQHRPRPIPREDPPAPVSLP